MQSKWTSSSTATDHVKTLLEQAGVPLELQVAHISHKFCDGLKTYINKNLPSSYISIHSNQVVYSPLENPQEYREIDQVITISEVLRIQERLIIELEFQIPIECKYRKNVEIFTIPSYETITGNIFPVFAYFSGTPFRESIKSSYKQFENERDERVILIELKQDGTPTRIFEENIVYNAAGALYDYILNDINRSSGVLQSEIGVLHISYINKDFQGFLYQNKVNVIQAIEDYARSIDNHILGEFRENRLKIGQYPPKIKVYLPIVCLSGPLYRARWKHDSGIEAFTPINYCISTIRKRGWPGPSRNFMLFNNNGVNVGISNHYSLLEILSRATNWFLCIRQIIRNFSDNDIHKWIIAAALLEDTLQKYSVKETTRDFTLSTYP